MVHRIAFLCLFLTVMAFSSTKAANSSFQIPRLSDITIDGKTDDWGENGFRIDVMVDENGRVGGIARFRAKARLAWNDEGLLVWAHIQDVTPNESDNPRRLFLADSIELFVAPDVGSPAYYMLAIAPGRDRRFPELRSIFFDKRFEVPTELDATDTLSMKVERQIRADGYDLEVLLPWSNLNIKPGNGRALGFQLYAMDNNGSDATLTTTWHPKADTHLNNTQSMYRLILSDKASEPYNATVRAVNYQLMVVADLSLLGKTTLVQQDQKELASGTLVRQRDVATAQFSLPRPSDGKSLGHVSVMLAGREIGAADIAGASALIYQAVTAGKPNFFQYVFAGTTFPKVAFELPAKAEELVGPCTFSTKFFNSNWNEVTQADIPDRYGAVVEIKSAFGRPAVRYFTLYRVDDTEPIPRLMVHETVMPSLDDLGPKGVKVTKAIKLNQDAAILRAARNTAPDVSEDARQAAIRANYQWWREFKQRYYSGGKHEAFLRPVTLETSAAAPILRDGTPEEAGMKPDVVPILDSICQEWLQVNKNTGFTVCCAHNGVVYFHRAYGQAPDGNPMTLETTYKIFSITKLFSATVMMMFVDQGLIRLDDPVDQYLPMLRGISVRRPMTVRMLYTHTSGMSGNWGDDLVDFEERIADQYAQIQLPVEHIYNGVSFALGARVMEFTSNESYTDLFQKYLLNPLGCQHTKVPDAWGGATSTALDLAKLAQMYVNAGSYGRYHFFSRETFEQMKPRRLNTILGEQTERRWGIGFWGANETIPEEGFLGHPSANSSTLRAEPDTGLVFTILSCDKTKTITNEIRQKFIDAMKSHLKQ